MQGWPGSENRIELSPGCSRIGGDEIDASTKKLLWVLPTGVVLSVLASLAGVWLLSEAIGMRFNPALVGALNGATSAILIGTRVWGDSP